MDQLEMWQPLKFKFYIYRLHDDTSSPNWSLEKDKLLLWKG